MFSTVLQELKSYFSRDFFLSVFFPVLFFMGLSVALFLEINYGLNYLLARWEKLSLQTQALAILCGLVVVTTLSYMTYNFQYVIIRLFEGYWVRVPVLRRLRNQRVRLHKRQWDYLGLMAQSAVTTTQMNEIIAEQLAFYPPPNHMDKMMPTQLGNILRATEIYTYDRYGIDATVIWTRLRLLLKDEDLEALEMRKTSLNFSILMTLLCSSFTLIWCPVLAIFTTRWELFLLCAAAWPLAWLSYRNAVQSALAYGEQLVAIFDLYRHVLFKALNCTIPPDLKTERKQWLRLTRFFYRNLPFDSVPPAPATPEGFERLANVLAAYLEKNDAPSAIGKSGDKNNS